MTTWNATDREIINTALDYARQRGIPIVFVPLTWQTSPEQPNVAEVSFLGRSPTVRRSSTRIDS